MENNNSCPNMLLEKDGEIHLFNTKKAVVPGVNPIKFTSLEEYAEFVEWQEGQGIHCPTLFLQYTTDTQNYLNVVIITFPVYCYTNSYTNR